MRFQYLSPSLHRPVLALFGIPLPNTSFARFYFEFTTEVQRSLLFLYSQRGGEIRGKNFIQRLAYGFVVFHPNVDASLNQTLRVVV